jgi:hypothetical protein
MAIDAEKRQFVDLEKKFWDAMQRKDGATAQRLTADQCVIVGAQGVSAIDRKTMSKLTTEGQWDLKSYEFDENTLTVQKLDEGTAVVAYKVRERLVVDGEELTLEANDSSVWVRRNGDWACSLHTESLAGDPYGRDRKR